MDKIPALSGYRLTGNGRIVSGEDDNRPNRTIYNSQRFRRETPEYENRVTAQSGSSISDVHDVRDVYDVRDVHMDAEPSLSNTRNQNDRTAATPSSVNDPPQQH